MGNSQSRKQEEMPRVYLNQKSNGEPLYHAPTELMNEPHYRIIGGIVTGQSRGTGFLIAPNLVMTTAHVVWNFKNRTMNTKIVFLWGNPQQIFEVDAKKILLSQRYRQGKSEAPTDDYALLTLKQKVSIREFLPIGFGLYKNIFDTKVESLSIFGYPNIGWIPISANLEDLRFRLQLSGLQIQKYIFSLRVSSVDFNQGQIKHSISTLQGQSGSPIFALIGKRLFIIGIHKGSLKDTDNDNVGMLFNNNILMRLRQSQPLNEFPICFNVSWNPIWNPLLDNFKNFDINDRTIIRTKHLSEEKAEIRSFSKWSQLQRERKLCVQFGDLKYSRNISVLSFGLVITLKSGKEQKIAYINRKESNRATGSIYGAKREPYQRQSKELFAREGDLVKLTVSLEEKEAIFVKIGFGKEIRQKIQIQIEEAEDISIFAEMRFQGDSLSISQ